ncbi:AP2/ERF domain-containing protein [Dioscorea alata]|uniref:AP2/ERF domain-containing protein n=1 Tax=Dioscorea alata TaxID=55571 RepID=A0ACB7VCN5_DIOAL|nr:AP2/ERF domain-containing protein [Dioscorea alata]
MHRQDSSPSSSSSSSSSSDHFPILHTNSSSSRTTAPSTSLSPMSRPSPKRKAGRKKFKETRHPVYCGVRHRNGGKWVCEIREPCTKNRIWLGTYHTPEMAARAHDVAAIALRGNSAQLNFPDLFSALPRAESASPDDIRRAASQAADMFSSCEPAASLQNDGDHSNGNGNGNQNSLTTAGERIESDKPPSTPTSKPMPVSVFVDEEEIFNMPELLNNMAEGMLITPPSMQQEFNWDVMDGDVEFSLWNDNDQL